MSRHFQRPPRQAVSRHPGRRALRVEALEPRWMLSTTSDAPPDYPLVQVTSNTGPILGASRAVDDGVVFSLMRVGQLGASVSVSVTNGSNARLDAWIDFNGDESFGGPDEQIFDSVPIGTGANQTLRFDIPSWAAAGTTYARFRIATALAPDDGLGHQGNQTNGEVEDYAIELIPPRPGLGDFGAERIVTQASGANGPADGPVDVLTGNFNRSRVNPNDTAMEIVTSSHIDGEIAIYRANASFTSWTREVIYNGADNPTPADPTAIGLAAGDLDGDGDLDLVSASANDDTIAWYRNASNASNWSFTRVEIDSGVAGARSVAVADFDRDGRLDLAVVSLEDGLVRLYRNTGNGDGELMFAPAVVAVDVSGIIAGLEGLADIITGDFDDDGFVDFATVEAITNRVVWYGNDTSPFNGAWAATQVLYDGSNTTEPNAAGVFTVDVDGDGDLDLIVTFRSEGRVDWFANNGSGNFSSTRNAVASGLNLPYPAYAADIDGDGDMDVLVPNSGANQLVWRRNNGSGGFSAGDTVAFTTPTNVVISDINGDGALDILAGSDTIDRVSWWQNPYLLPDIVVRGNGQIINDGDVDPRNADGTLYGSVPLGGTPIIRTFVIHNPSGGILNVYDVQVPAGFTLVQSPAATVAPGGQTSFQVRLDTSAPGPKEGDVVIRNDDDMFAEYNFRIKGTVIAPLAGDYNSDGVVDARDYTVWRDTLGSTTDLRANGDDTGASQGRIDAADYLVWKNNFGATAGALAMADGEEEAPQGPTSLPVASTRREALPFRPVVRKEVVQQGPPREFLLIRSDPPPRSSTRGDAEIGHEPETRFRPPAREYWADLADEALAAWES
jgi:hypothetical protein